jgi:hypothetical protein
MREKFLEPQSTPQVFKEQLLVKSDSIDQLVCIAAESADVAQECLVPRSDVDARTCKVVSTHAEFVPSAMR